LTAVTVVVKLLAKQSPFGVAGSNPVAVVLSLFLPGLLRLSEEH